MTKKELAAYIARRHYEETAPNGTMTNSASSEEKKLAFILEAIFNDDRMMAAIIGLGHA